MSASGLDPRLTFSTYIVGPANRLASAAALRVAQAPGASYNPLVLYGASGLGKTHLLMAIGAQAAQQHPHIEIIYGRCEQLLAAREAKAHALRERLAAAQLLLLDEIQWLAGRPDAQETLLHVWDAILAHHGQLVLACDRPLREIALAAPLHSRITSGLVADVAPPEHETRVAIAERLALQRGQTLEQGVAQALADLAFGSVRELQGGLNRLLAVQELEERPVRASEVAALLGRPGRNGAGEFGSLVSDVSGALGEALERLSPEQRIAEAILRWEGEGFATTRLDVALARDLSTQESKEVVARFESDVTALRAVEHEIRAVDASAPELARVDVLRDPDQLSGAQMLLSRARERKAATRGAPEPTADGNGAASTAARPHAGAPPARLRAPAAPRAAQGIGVNDAWFLSREKVLWDWPFIEDLLLTDAD